MGRAEWLRGCVGPRKRVHFIELGNTLKPHILALDLVKVSGLGMQNRRNEWKPLGQCRQADTGSNDGWPSEFYEQSPRPCRVSLPFQRALQSYGWELSNDRCSGIRAECESKMGGPQEGGEPLAATCPYDQDPREQFSTKTDTGHNNDSTALSRLHAAGSSDATLSHRAQRLLATGPAVPVIHRMCKRYVLNR